MLGIVVKLGLGTRGNGKLVDRMNIGEVMGVVTLYDETHLTFKTNISWYSITTKEINK